MKEFIDIIKEAESTVIDRPPVSKQQEVPLNVPGGATVMILNDDITPWEVVVEAIMHGTGLSEAEAMRRMRRAHEGGWAPIASYASRDLAETVANRIQSHAMNNRSYDHYRRYSGYQGPWPLAVEVVDAEQ